MTDIANLGFAIDTTQVRRAQSDLRDMRTEASNASAQAREMSGSFSALGGPMGEFRQQTQQTIRGVRDTTSAIDDLIDRVGSLTRAMGTFSGPIVELRRTTEELQSLGRLFGTTAAGMENMGRASRAMGLDANEMVGALQRIQAALAGVTAEGQRTRQVLSSYGVSVAGRGVNDAGDIAREFAAATRRTRDDSLSRFDMQAVLGPLSAQTITSLTYPDITTDTQRARTDQARETAQRSAEIRENAARVTRQAEADRTRMSLMESEYGYLNTPFTGVADAFRLTGVSRRAERQEENRRYAAANGLPDAESYRAGAPLPEGSAPFGGLAREWMVNQQLEGPLSGGVGNFLRAASPGLRLYDFGRRQVARAGYWLGSDEYDANNLALQANYDQQWNESRYGGATLSYIYGRALNLGGFLNQDSPRLQLSPDQREQLSRTRPYDTETSIIANRARMDPNEDGRRRVLTEAAQGFGVDTSGFAGFEASDMTAMLGRGALGDSRRAAVQRRFSALDDAGATQERREMADGARVRQASDAALAAGEGVVGSERARTAMQERIRLEKQLFDQRREVIDARVAERMADYDANLINRNNTINAQIQTYTQAAQTQSNTLRAGGAQTPTEIAAASLRARALVESQANPTRGSADAQLEMAFASSMLGGDMRVNSAQAELSRQREVFNLGAAAGTSDITSLERRQQIERETEEAMVRALTLQGEKREEAVRQVEELRRRLGEVRDAEEDISRAIATQRQARSAGAGFSNVNASLELDRTPEDQRMRGQVMNSPELRRGVLTGPGEEKLSRSEQDRLINERLYGIDAQGRRVGVTPQMAEQRFNAEANQRAADASALVAQRFSLDAQLRSAAAGGTGDPRLDRELQRSAQRNEIESRGLTPDLQRRQLEILDTRYATEDSGRVNTYFRSLANEREDAGIRSRFYLGDGAGSVGSGRAATVAPGGGAPINLGGTAGDIRGNNALYAAARQRVLDDTSLSAGEQANALRRLSAGHSAANGTPEIAGGYRANAGVDGAYDGLASPSGRVANLYGASDGGGPMTLAGSRSGGGFPSGAVPREGRVTDFTYEAARRRLYDPDPMEAQVSANNRIRSGEIPESRRAQAESDEMATRAARAWGEVAQSATRAAVAFGDGEARIVAARTSPYEAGRVGALQSVAPEVERLRARGGPENLAMANRREQQALANYDQGILGRFEQDGRNLEDRTSDASFQVNNWYLHPTALRRQLAEQQMRRELDRSSSNIPESDRADRVRQAGVAAELEEQARLNQTVRDSFYEMGAASLAWGRNVATGAMTARQALASFAQELGNIALRRAGTMLLEQAWKSGGNFLQGFLGKSGGVAGVKDGSEIGAEQVSTWQGSEIMPAAQGAAFNARGAITMMAQGGGGIASAPMLIPMANGNTAMIGEAGEEAVLPLKRGPDGRLGVQTSGGGGGGTVFNINVTSAGSSGNAAADHAHAVKQANEIERSMRSFVADELRRQARPGGMLGSGNGTLGGIG